MEDISLKIIIILTQQADSRNERDGSNAYSILNSTSIAMQTEALKQTSNVFIYSRIDGNDTERIEIHEYFNYFICG